MALGFADFVITVLFPAGFDLRVSKTRIGAHLERGERVGNRSEGDASVLAVRRASVYLARSKTIVLTYFLPLGSIPLRLTVSVSSVGGSRDLINSSRRKDYRIAVHTIGHRQEYFRNWI